jgi:hypothetical protein
MSGFDYMYVLSHLIMDNAMHRDIFITKTKSYLSYRDHTQTT